MIRSMYSAISGLRNHQTMMDVVGNNISNVNTTGFKGSAVVFQDVLLQTIRGAGQPATALGGTNPAQVGLGSRIGAITTNFGQGAMQRTGRSTDMAIQGDGFFTVNQAGQTLYTRSGTFSIDAQGRLVTQEGAFVQGWLANQAGEVNTNADPDNLVIPVGSLIPPEVTRNVVIGGNLPSSAVPVTTPASMIPANGAGSVAALPVALPAGSTVTTSVEIFDSLGNPVPLTLTYFKTSGSSAVPSVYEVRATVPDATTPGNVFVLSVGGGAQLQFDADGNRTVPAPPANLTITQASLNAAGYPAFNAGAVTLDLGLPEDAARLTGYALTNTASVQSQDGSSAGGLQSFTVSQEGLIVGSYSNGRTQSLGQLALSVFANPEGLEKVGGSNFRVTVNSGLPQTGLAGTGGRGLLTAGAVEMSNVDLAQEFTNLIVAQRGFQANSRVVSSSDDLLQEIVNLKR